MTKLPLILLFIMFVFSAFYVQAETVQTDLPHVYETGISHHGGNSGPHGPHGGCGR